MGNREAWVVVTLDTDLTSGQLEKVKLLRRTTRPPVVDIVSSRG